MSEDQSESDELRILDRCWRWDAVDQIVELVADVQLADLASAVEREIERVKAFWLDGIAKVVAAPAGATVQVLQQDVTLTGSTDAAPIRLSADADAPVFRAIQADKLYPHRQTELLKLLREKLNAKISPHDLQCVRRVHKTDDNPTFSYKAHWSPRQYSDAFVDWLIEQHAADPDFFQKARDANKQGPQVSSA